MKSLRKSRPDDRYLIKDQKKVDTRDKMEVKTSYKSHIYLKIQLWKKRVV